MNDYKLIAFCKWCQELPIDQLAKTIKELGFDGVDLPCRPSSPYTHANAPEKLPEVKKVFEDHGLTLDRLVTKVQDNDEETERFLDTVQNLGIKKIRISGYSIGKDQNARDRLDEARIKLEALEKILAKYNVMGAIQNHSGNTLDVNISSCLLMMQDRNPKWLGIQYDPGHLTLSGESIKLAIELMGPYLHSVNFKSPRKEYCTDPGTGHLIFKPIWVPLQDGMLDVPGNLKALQDAGYTDPISIHAEYRTHYYLIEKDLEGTNKIVKDDVTYIRKMIAENN